jgi:hypothetical protein
MTAFRLNCVNHFLAIDDPLFVKWGRPINLGQYAHGEYEYQCGKCLATWVGPNGDHCYWCHKRWQIAQDDAKQSLLIPEWLTWDRGYFALDAKGQSVWENTRGFNGDFVGAWERRILKAKLNGEITTNEWFAAVKRVLVWMMRKQSKQ